MATTESIARALFTRMTALVTDPVLAVAWPDVPFTPTTGTPYLAVSFLPNGNQRRFIGSSAPHRHIGIMQVDVMWPKGQGEIQPLKVAGQVAAHFPCDLALYQDGIRVRITKEPDIVGPLSIKDGWLTCPISIQFEAWV